MKLKMLFAALTMSAAAMAQTTVDPIIMTVNGEPVVRSEFEYSYNKNNFNYSLPELNKRIQHYYYNYDSPTYQQGDDQTRGAVKATAWTSNGMTFMGFEDGGQDEDLNDIVFWV